MMSYTSHVCVLHVRTTVFCFVVHEYVIENSDFFLLNVVHYRNAREG